MTFSELCTLDLDKKTGHDAQILLSAEINSAQQRKYDPDSSRNF